MVHGISSLPASFDSFPSFLFFSRTRGRKWLFFPVFPLSHLFIVNRDNLFSLTSPTLNREKVNTWIPEIWGRFRLNLLGARNFGMIIQYLILGTLTFCFTPCISSTLKYNLFLCMSVNCFGYHYFSRVMSPRLWVIIIGRRFVISHNYKRESLNLRAIFLGHYWTNRDISYTNSIQNFMEIHMTRPDFPNFASPLNKECRELPGRALNIYQSPTDS